MSDAAAPSDPNTPPTVPEHSSDAPVDGSGAMFDRIARRYDRLNRVLSLGMDIGWRKAATKALQLPANARVLDVATGTGDLAIDILRAHKDATVDGLDPAARMLDIAVEKVAKKRIADRFTRHLGDAQAMDFPDDTFNGATIAFGIRNVPDRMKGLREMARVVKPGGRVVVLELTEPKQTWLSLPARMWVHHLVPRIGAWMSSDKEYRYLQKSIAAFPPPNQFAAMMADAGLTDVKTRLLGFGSVGLFTGTVPHAS